MTYAEALAHVKEVQEDIERKRADIETQVLELQQTEAKLAFMRYDHQTKEREIAEIGTPPTELETLLIVYRFDVEALLCSVQDEIKEKQGAIARLDEQLSRLGESVAEYEKHDD